VLRLRAAVVGAGPSGPGMAQQTPGTYCGAFTAVLRAIRKLMTPNGAPQIESVAVTNRTVGNRLEPLELRGPRI